MNIKDIVEFLESNGLTVSLLGDEAAMINQVASLDDAKAGDLSFLSDRKRVAELNRTQATAVLIREEMILQTNASKILVDNPYVAYALIAQKLNKVEVLPGIHSSSIISTSAIIPKSCQIDASVVIADNVTLGENCVIGAGCVVEYGTSMGDNCHLYPNVTLMHQTVMGNDVTIESGTVIGGQGFGFANQKGRWLRIPQIGRVVIGNNCWIGNNCAIDRGAINDTVIHDNCILDNLIHMAHNVEIGEGSAIAGQVGFAGSAKVGKYCIFAGQVGVNGHIEISDQSQFAAKSGVTHSIKTAGSYSGFPAVNTTDWQKSTVRTKNLDKMAKQITQLEKELEKLKKQLED